MCTHKFFYLFKVIDVNYIYHGDHLTVYTHIESLGCTPETNVSYTLKKKRLMEKKGIAIVSTSQDVLEI